MGSRRGRRGGAANVGTRITPSALRGGSVSAQRGGRGGGGLSDATFPRTGAAFDGGGRGGCDGRPPLSVSGCGRDSSPAPPPDVDDGRDAKRRKRSAGGGGAAAP